jgi:hypothetical protein
MKKKVLLASRGRFLGVVVMGVIGAVILGAVFGEKVVDFFRWNGGDGEEMVVIPKPEVIMESLVGEIYFGTNAGGGGKSVQELFGVGYPADDLRRVGIGLILSSKQLVTANHVMGKQQGSYYFFNESFGWNKIDSFESVPDRDIAFGTFWDEMPQKVPNELIQFADKVEEGEEVYMWVHDGQKMQKIVGKVLTTNKMIMLQQTWGEIQNVSLETIEVRAENNLGDSGSPIFNWKAEVIGIVVGVDLQDEMTTYVVRL